jgi:hypothetical protein
MPIKQNVSLIKIIISFSVVYLYYKKSINFEFHKHVHEKFAETWPGVKADIYNPNYWGGEGRKVTIRSKNK